MSAADIDPIAVLGLPDETTPEEVHARYAELVKRHPPDRDPKAFERIRDAYRVASDPRWRARHRITGPEPASPSDLEELLRRGRRPAQGASAWLAVLSEGRRDR